MIHGVVQGVGFRAWVWRAAQQRGLAGRAVNRFDGTVEVVLEGPAEAVDEVVRLCREGPRGAVVTDVELYEETPTGGDDFSAG